jgi:hypothetical protein
LNESSYSEATPIATTLRSGWQDEWDLKGRGSDRSVNRHDTCRGAAYLNEWMQPIADKSGSG